MEFFTNKKIPELSKKSLKRIGGLQLHWIVLLIFTGLFFAASIFFSIYFFLGVSRGDIFVEDTLSFNKPAVTFSIEDIEEVTTYFDKKELRKNEYSEILSNINDPA